ncbi:DNA primase family protein [uncultured Lentilactobacillus sp.]|uniref:DNA primase family protein n=1 Tax=uncultured Lentilactobacillus sp. TaxID=2805375 RepID=UPI00259251EC|nr:DNA primase family protein [uncultured Lentilactobacillus sp.]
MDSEAQMLAQQYDQTVNHPHTLKDKLMMDVQTWQLDHQTKAQAKNDTLPRLTTLAGSQIMQRHFITCLFSDNESARLAIYLPHEGIYTQNYRYIKRLIGMMYAPFNEREAEEVIYHLINWAKVKEPTVDRYLIPVANGIWNLHRHELIHFSPDYVFTTKIATKYVNNPVPPNINGWTVDGWLNEIANHDPEIVKLLWEIINDSLNGNFTRKKAIFLYSEKGNTGKGTFQQLIQNLVGKSNVGSLKVNQFDERFKLALLVGKTVCIGDDTPPDIYIKDSSSFNSVVTGDLVTIEYKGQDGFTTTLRCTVIQSCNGLPNFHNKGGTMRRMIIVPFNNHFEGSNDNWDIRDDYMSRQDVLQYVLYRALQLDFKKFDVPTVSKQALSEFEKDNDPLIGFREFFLSLEVDKIPTYYVYEYYKKYCQINGLKALGQNKFIRRLLPLIPDYAKRKAKATHEVFQQANRFKTQDEITVYVRMPEIGKGYQCLIKKVKK